MSKQGKIWGETTEFFRSCTVSAHHLRIREGGYCSEHRHARKANLFYIVRGRLEITIFWQKGIRELQDVTVIEAGQTAEIPPGVWHRFRALGETEAIEIYRVRLEDPDIERRTQGG